ncbi:MAG: hypothetical protein HKN22_02165 [Bacteroidia bacterium]|nr:hypothetical protein [Bacteroidia bacterium]
MNNKLIILLQNLDKRELSELNKFIHSPYHNRHERVIALYDHLRKGLRKEPFDLDKDTLFSYIFPDEKYSDSKLRHLFSYLLDVIESYLEIKALESDHFERKIKLLRAYRRKKLYKHFDNTRVLLEKYDSKHSKRDLEYHFQQYQLSTEVYDQVASSTRSEQINLQELTDNLDIFYIASKLKIACHVLMFKNLFKKEHEMLLFEHVLKLVEERKLYSIPIVGIYYHTYMTLTRPQEEKYFFELKQQLSDNADKFTKDETRDIHLLAINYCIRKLNDGHDRYLEEVFTLYRVALNNEALLIEGKLSPYTYINIASASLKLFNYDWAEDFINKYRDQLNTNDVESFYTYAKAQWLFATSRFSEVTDLLLQTDIKDFFAQLQARVLLLKSYFELSEFELMDSGVENFRQLVGRKKILAYHKTNYSNFARYLKRLSRINPNDADEIQKFQDQVRKVDILTEKSWFLEKAREMT